jgi:endonuclease/exonuclease/phosphatase family metal-dependent hydrolase
MYTMISRLCIFWLIAAFAADAALGQTGHIVIDEDFADWELIETAYDREEDQGLFRRVWVANDDQYLYLSIEVASEVVLQNSGIVLYIDTDASAETGLDIHGIGADLEWHFGDRRGVVRQEGTAYEIRHAVIGVVNAPTVSSTRFEIAIRRDAAHPAPIFAGDDIRLVLIDEESEDVAPHEGVVEYTFREVQRERPGVSLERAEGTDVRVLSYNVLRDGPFFGRDLTFGRIIAAIAPDVIGFQEMYSTSASFVKEWLERDVPGEDGAGWHVERAANDVMLASRFPIRNVDVVEHHDLFAPRTAAFTVDLRPAVESDLVVYVTHTSCCENNVARQEQLDAMMGHLRESKEILPHGTPFMLIGDFNLVTFEAQRRTVLEGAISDTDRYGPAFIPDWDDTFLVDLKPHVAGLPMTFTWHDEGSNFSPGRLDYIFYSDYALSSLGSFVLFTPALLEEELAMYGLGAGDTRNASDHLPLAGDFRVKTVGAANPFSLDGAVYALIEDGDDIIAAGSFTSASNTQLQRVARWDGGSWHAVGTELDGQINALERLPGGALYAGGQFPWIGIEQQVSVRYLADDETWRHAGEELKGRVNALAVRDDGTLLAGGWISEPARHMATFDGESWQALSAEPNGEVHTLAFHPSGDLYAGGFFTAADGMSAAGIARWDGESWTALGDGLPGTVRAITFGAEGNLYAGGDFSMPSASSGTHHVARWDGSEWSSMLQIDDSDARVYALAMGPGDALVVGGSFEYGGRHHGLLKWDGSGWSTLELDVVSGAVHALLVREDGLLVAGGDFHYDGEVRGRNIAVVDAFSTDTAIEADGVAKPSGLSVEIYPNPATDRVTLMIHGADGASEVGIYDVLGRRVRSFHMATVQSPLHSTTLKTADLSPGVYLVRVTSGRQSITSTLIVVR